MGRGQDALWPFSRRFSCPLPPNRTCAFPHIRLSTCFRQSRVTSSPYLSIRYTERLAEIGVEPSSPPSATAYDNALAESIIGLFKTELIYGPDQGLWRGLEHVELATLSYIHWFNNERTLARTCRRPLSGK